ncbi:ATP-dependent zinc metalloprotease FtsH [Desulforhopalus singaporensis]|uniref:ATP-dependent zinc metalloprotease FtsH n=1 Tax=Desulforhopalus singaporensis TaxID=91360 RepID=A0A1H0N3X0_9BACT|nr:ATP-dependent zinc metalloprotease FtsH [Desulforhopalus singaporensis]SDO87311.1 cell division protease FtsH [Desulforhopalus singaporensis]
MAILVRNLFIYFLVVGSCLLAGMFFFIEKKLPEKSYSEFLLDLSADGVSEIQFTGNRADVVTVSGYSYCAQVPEPGRLVEQLQQTPVKIGFSSDYTPFYFQAALFVVGLSFLFVVWVSLTPRRNGDSKDRFASTKLVSPEATKEWVTFDDVAGAPEAKEELQEVVSFLKDPSQFNRLGAFMPKGILLQGPPGTGKTLLARAIAGEAKVPFFSFSGSDFVEMFVGVGASRVRDLFREAKKKTPCIVFIDEIDAVGSSRVTAPSDGQDERGQTLNALLVEMDGFGSTDNVIVLAATNRPDILDPALSRPGRFDRRITLLPPDVRGRGKILKVHSKKSVLGPDVNLEEIAQMTSGFTGAELANLVNEAAILAGRDHCDAIAKEHFDQARDRIMLGVERKGVVLKEKDKLILAYHEAGHAIIAKLLPDADPVHKITIIPRGRALGQTQQLPLGDRTAYSRPYLVDRITTLLGGRAAEQLIFDSRTTQAENDFLQATEIATNMVCRWGMSDALGTQAYAISSESFLGDEGTRMYPMSADTARLIDREIKILLSRCYKNALDILSKERFFLKSLSDILLQVETIDAEEFDIIYQCANTKKAEEAGTIEKESECSVCPARGHCLEYKAN